MNRFLSKIIFCLVAVMGLEIGCTRFPSHRLTDPAPEGAVSPTSASWVLYDEELRTGGGVYLFPSGENQTLILDSREAASSGSHSISYQWNGQDVRDASSGTQHLFAGFGLLVAPEISQINQVPARDLSSAGFTKISFKVRGTLSENTVLRAEGPSDGSSAQARLDISASQLTPEWTQFTLPASGAFSASAFKNVKIYINFTFVYAQPTATTNAGEGGSVTIDQIVYEK